MKLSIQTLIWSAITIAIVVAGVIAFLPKPVLVETAEATLGELTVTVQEDGKSRIREKYVVSAPVSGQLTRIELQEGDELPGLDTLLAVILPSEPSMLDARTQAEARARVKATEAALQRAEATAKQSDADYELKKARFDRASNLHETKSISKADYDIARTDMLVSQQAIEAADFGVEIARFELQMAQAAVNQFGDSRDTEVTPFEIFTPVKGKVLNVFEESATSVALGTPLIEVGDPRNLELEIDVLSSDAVRIKPGAELTVEHWGGKDSLKGHVRVIEPAAFTKVSSLGVEEQRVNIIADFDEPGERMASLGDGYRVEARITIEQLNDVIRIPNSALFRNLRKWHVFLVVNGRATKTEVSIGAQNETMTEIKGGLVQGDQVIVYPSDKLTDGSRVKKAE